MIQASLKPLIFLASLVPFLLLVAAAATGGLGANPVERLLHRTGDWALNFLLITLAVTPLRTMTGWSPLGRLRRMTGLFAFFYASLHALVYIGVDKGFSWTAVLQDAVRHKRIYVGFASFAILGLLAATSRERAMRRLGMRRWQRLHLLAYAAAFGGVLHYLLLVKQDLRAPLVYAALFAALMAFRAAVRLYRRVRPPQ